MLKERLQQDLKKAMLEGDKHRASLLNMLKSAILYAEVAGGAREKGLADEEIVKVLAREAKQRQDSAEAYEKAEAFDKRDQELSEKAIIEEYLPAQMSEDELHAKVDEAIAELGPLSPQTLGRIIGSVKQRVGAAADGGRVATAVKARLEKEEAA